TFTKQSRPHSWQSEINTHRALAGALLAGAAAALFTLFRGDRTEKQIRKLSGEVKERLKRAA
ncbi:MAG TPA: hypothetical protein VE783_13450, partial [Candidatus Limnocylindrales bacterium]|nr:hypothetical protein [Candidatus Limnocylindrales bacterium]